MQKFQSKSKKEEALIFTEGREGTNLYFKLLGIPKERDNSGNGTRDGSVL